MSLPNTRTALESALKYTWLFVLAFTAATVGCFVQARGMDVPAFGWFVGAGMLAGWWFRANTDDRDNDDFD